MVTETVTALQNGTSQVLLLLLTKSSTVLYPICPSNRQTRHKDSNCNTHLLLTIIITTSVRCKVWITQFCWAFCKDHFYKWQAWNECWIRQCQCWRKTIKKMVSLFPCLLKQCRASVFESIDNILTPQLSAAACSHFPVQELCNL